MKTTRKKPAKRKQQKISLQQLRSSYPKSAVLFHEKDEQDCAYIIEKGEVEISVLREGKRVPVNRLGEGRVLGETALLGIGKRTATAIATKNCIVFRISPNLLHDRIMQMDPLVGLLISLLVNRYRQWEAPSKGTAQIHRKNLKQRENTAGFLHILDTQKQIALKELRLAQEITEALSKEEFVPYLQPIVSLKDMRLKGFEMLVRWHHPVAGIISPADFVPVAERTNIIRHLDLMMLQQACNIVQKIQKAARTKRKIYLSVNFSGGHFNSEEFSRQIMNTIRKSGVDPRQLVLEITESALMGNTVTAEKVLKRLKKFGLAIMLDDFGTGYSSLSYLHRYSIDRLKIDQSFVRDIHNKKNKSRDVVQAIVSLAKAFDVSLVAEGIGSKEDIALLSSLGCNTGQGYFFGKPMPLDKALKFITRSVKRYG